ncbi:MAG: SIMPL domain-containing protein [Thermoprotei archaeon]|nr:SIMPL domain-containing protein [Thermoprotei archaeon]
MSSISTEWIGKVALILCILAVIMFAANIALIPKYIVKNTYGTYGTRELRIATSKNICTTNEEVNVKTIRVVGVGKATSKPELVKIRISVVTRADEAASAQESASEKMSNVIRALTNYGIKEDQIKTVFYSLRPVYEYERGKQIFVGYECVNTIEVELEEIDKVGKVIDLAVANGANRVDSLIFTLKSETIEKLKSEALKKAVEDARSKAEAVAQAASIELLGPISISVESGIVYRVSETVTIPMYKETSTTPIIPPEELSITATVTIIYEFK